MVKKKQAAPGAMKGLAAILLMIEEEADPTKSAALEFVLKGSVEKLSVTRKDVERYLKENRAAVADELSRKQRPTS